MGWWPVIAASIAWGEPAVELSQCPARYALPEEQEQVHRAVVEVRRTGRSTPGLVVAEGGWVLTTAAGLDLTTELSVRSAGRDRSARVVRLDAEHGFALVSAPELEAPCLAVSHSLPDASAPLFDLGGLGGPVMDASGLLVGFRQRFERAEALTGRRDLLPMSFVSERLGVRWRAVEPGPPAIDHASVHGVTIQSVTFAGLRDDAVLLESVEGAPFAAFAIGRREVTQALWSSIRRKNPSGTQSELKPVDSVSFASALAFCNALSEREGLTPAYAIEGDQVVWSPDANGYRLPTADEWELAARAGGESVYPGSEQPDPVAWYWGSGVSSARPVGTKRPNAWGLYDTAGNVAEWVWTGPYAQSITAGTALVRGGSWRSSRIDLRLDRVGTREKVLEKDTVGFRLARSAR